MAYCARVFARTLDGHKLVANNSQWRPFPWSCRTERWSYRNLVLVGDALHTAHFSIGSGTRLALGGRHRAGQGSRRRGGLGRGRRAAGRRPPSLRGDRGAPVLGKLLAAAAASADWHEKRFPEHMALSPGASSP